jgi:D-lactate dehydrogenase
MKITFFKAEDWMKSELTPETFAGHEVDFVDGPLLPEAIPADTSADILCVFVGSLVSKEVIEKFPNLKCVATRSTGFDHIDLETCKKKGIAVLTVPAYGDNTVAEHAFGLLLALSKRIFDGYDRLRETGRFSPDGLVGFDLKGKTFGVVGTGKIGRSAIAIAKGFGMNVVAYDPYPNTESVTALGFEYKTFDELLAVSDIISIHVPHTDSTHHLFNADTFAKMKKGSVLINTSRGPIVETESLVRALNSGQLFGAGLDVLEEEGAISDEMALLTKTHETEPDYKVLIADHVLIDMQNVIVTPHNAFNTREALQRIAQTTIQNINAFIGGNPQNDITKK